MKFTTYILISALLSAALVPIAAQALPTTIYASRSKLAEGRWVKIKVTGRGIQQISDDELRHMGFSDPSKVTVFGYGGALLGDGQFSVNMPDDLPQQTVMRHGGRLLFYGEPGRRVDMQSPRQPKLIQNYDSDHGYYFLTDSRSYEAPAAIPYRESSDGDLTGYIATEVIREEIQNPMGCGALFYGHSLNVDGAPGYSFDVSRRLNGTGVTIAGAVGLGGVTPAVDISVGGMTRTCRAYGEIAGVSVKRFEIVVDADGVPADGKLDVSFVTSSSDVRFAAVDYIAASYPAKADLDGRRELIMTCSVRADQRYRVGGTSESAVPWQIRTADKVRPFTTRHDAVTGDLLFSPFQSYSSSGYYDYVIVFEPDAEHHTVEYAGTVGNQNIHAARVPDYLIITTDECRGQADRLAALHRSVSGLDVLVVTASEVYNEFSSGTPSAEAYRRVAKMFHDRDSRKFKYMLLMGGATNDSRSRAQSMQVDPRKMLLTYPSREYESQLEDALCYTADAYFAMLGDDMTGATMKSQTDGPAIAVGRVPALSEGDARSYVDKVEAFLKTPFDPDVTTRAVVMSDDGDADAHMIQAQELAAEITAFSPVTTVTRAYNAIYPWSNGSAAEARRHITDALKAGAFYWCYIGHGRPDSFTSENLWHRRYVSDVSYGYQPFTFLSTCESFGFDRLNSAIGEAMLFKTDGGALAVVGAGRTVYKENNQILNLAFARNLFGSGDAATVGDAWRMAQAEMFATRSPDLKINTLAYNLGGDPALPLRRATLNLSVTSVNGAGDGIGRLVSPALNRVTGSVTDEAGNIIRSFNGTMMVRVYESPDSVDNLYQPTNGKKVPEKERVLKRVELDETILTEATAVVADGNFDFTLALPPSIRPGQRGRLVMTAVTESGREAAAVTVPVDLDDASVDEISDDSQSPVIDELFIDSASFVDGDVVNSDFVLHASVLPDQSGIAVRTSSIGLSPRVVIDNSRSLDNVIESMTLSPDQSARLSLPVVGLADGFHTLTLTVSDNVGNKTSRSIGFTVVTTPADVALMTEDVPARQSLTLTLDHGFTGEPSGRVVIEDLDGTAVFSRDNVSFPFMWDLVDNHGNHVSDGTYVVRAYLRHERRFAVTPPLEITVLR